MRCGRCGKNFDEEMYSGICPKCGHFNNRQTEYDVSKYFSAKFDDGGKTSTNAQAAKQHEQLHKMYDSSNMHKPGAGHHEKLHDMYDKVNMHQQGRMTSRGYQQTGNFQGEALGKKNPYQRTLVQGNPYQTKQNASYPQGSYPKQPQYRQPNLNGEAKEKNVVTPICIVVSVIAVLLTVFLALMKKNSLTQAYNTLDYEQQYAGAGEVFEIDGRLLLVDKAEVIDTYGLPDLSDGEKLVAVTVEVLPTDDRNRNYMSSSVYVSDGYNCKQYLDSYVLSDYLDVEDLFTGYDYLYSPAEGLNGRFYFLVDDGAEEITISFDENEEKDTIFILQKRVSVALQLEEEES